MTRSLIAPVIPPAIPAPVRGLLDGRGRRLPLADPLPCAPRTGDVVYGLGRIDASGRIADRAVTCALGWLGGDRLTLTAEAGAVIARRDCGGMITVPARPCVVIPAGLRRRCGLRPGDRVLLAALLLEDVLAAYPLAVVDQAIRAHHLIPGRPAGTR